MLITKSEHREVWRRNVQTCSSSAKEGFEPSKLSDRFYIVGKKKYIFLYVL